ncbi:hypothetical protein SO802_015167 [Lithocarpus litseifolius]|uniref:Uncharacterized protein n=1 Tax=Lithocarpus litseifolius TaxID=425828 RepID=A0AAW2CY91_9ROSI
MARAKSKSKGLPCPLKPLNPYTLTLNGKFVKARDSQHYWKFPKLRYDPKTRTMIPGFELLFDCNNKLPKLKKEDANWVPTDWADYMDPDAMTTFLGDAICNIEEEEYWEACQHVLKSPYEVRISDEEGVEAPSDDDEDYDSQYNAIDWGEPPSDREDEDEGLYYEDYDNDVDYYDGDIEDDANAKAEPIDMGSDARSDSENMEWNESEYLPQYIHQSNKGKQDLFSEWMDSIERLDTFVTDKPTDMEIDSEGMDYMDKDPSVLMLTEEGTH